MASISQVLDALEQTAPARFALSFDKVGLQVGSPSQEVTTAVVSLDHSSDAIQFALCQGAQLLLTHHPLVWNPIDRLTDQDSAQRQQRMLIEARMASIAAHTNWDCADGGINDILAHRLGLANIRKFGSSADEDFSVFRVYAPGNVLTEIVDALHKAGLGIHGSYQGCAFLTKGFGTFIPQPGSEPYSGQIGERESVQESKIEILIPSRLEPEAVRAVRAVHPYEEPVYFSSPAGSRPACPIGRVGDLPHPMSLADFTKLTDSALGTKSLAWGRGDSIIQSVAVVGGSAADEWTDAQAAGAQVLVTGEVPQHLAVDAFDADFALLSSGHYATEQPGTAELASRMASCLPEVEWKVFEPEPGRGGRPL